MYDDVMCQNGCVITVVFVFPSPWCSSSESDSRSAELEGKEVWGRDTLTTLHLEGGYLNRNSVNISTMQQLRYCESKMKAQKVHRCMICFGLFGSLDDLSLCFR